ncbi:hypothetical protein Tco_0454561 [Tanacetum coccineum]
MSARITETTALSPSSFHKRYRSSYKTSSSSSPPPALTSRKRYRGTSKLVEDTEDESSDSGTKREGSEGESHGSEDESHGSKDEGPGSEDEGPGSEEEEEATPEGQQQAVSAENTAVDKPLGLGYEALRRQHGGAKRVSAFRQPTLVTWVDFEDGRVYTDIPTYVPPAAPVQTPPSPEWSSRSLSVSPSFLAVPTSVS